MAWTTLNALDCPIASWSTSHEGVTQDQARALNGSYRTTRAAVKRVFALSTPVMTQAEAAAFVAVLLFRHDVCAFDVDTYSSKGRAPDAATGLSIQADHKKFGANAAHITSGTSRFWELGDTGDKTLLVWKRPGSGSFDHWAITRNAAGTEVEYKNGAVGSYTTTNWKTFSSAGTVTLMGKNDAGTNTAVQYDDLVVVPALLTAAQIAQLAASTTAWADSPYILLSGDCVSGTPVEVQALADGTSVAATNGNGGNVHVSISATLAEV